MVFLLITDQPTMQAIRKVILQGLGLSVLSIGLWVLLAQVDWMGIYRIRWIQAEAEEQLGKVVWFELSLGKEEVRDREVITPIDTILTRLCLASGIDREAIKLRILKEEETNALALPDHQLVLYTQLIEEAQTPEELAGVMAHELSHIEHKHVMRSLAQNFGTFILINATGSTMAGEVLQHLLTTSFSRDFEREADHLALELLTVAEVDIEGFADFFERLAKREEPLAQHLSWLSTHPGIQERIQYTRERQRELRNKGYKPKPLLSPEEWALLKERITESRVDEELCEPLPTNE